MSILISLVFTTLLLPLLYNFFIKKRNIFDIELVLFGAAIYVCLPLLVFSIGSHEIVPGANTWEPEFFQFYQNGASNTLFFLFIYIASYIIGRVSTPLFSLKTLNKPISFPALTILAIGILFSLTALTYEARDSIGKGYSIEYNPSIMGPIATLNLLILLITLNIRQFKINNNILKIYYFSLAISSLVLLSLGGRLYVLTALIALTLQTINASNTSTLTRLKHFFYFMAFIIILITVGLWRADSENSLNVALGIALAEPFLTSISMATFFNCGEHHAFKTPLNYFSSIINFVPSFLLSEKQHLIVQLSETGGCTYRPFGATHISYSVLDNFGYIGSIFYFMAFGYLLKIISHTSKSGWWLQYYLIAILPFIFFRESFAIFNKTFFFSGIIFSILLILFSKIFRNSTNSPR